MLVRLNLKVLLLKRIQMPLKKLNEEVLPSVIKKTKKVPVQFKNFWEKGLTAGKLKKMIADIPDNTILLKEGMDHTYDLVSVKFITALFDSQEEIINEDFGEEVTPQSKYGKRKEVILIT